LKYLARDLTGGPISDRRLIDHQNGQITFWARSGDKRRGNPSQPYTLPGAKFTQRWTWHILPKRFVKSRCYGGWSGRCRAAYLDQCRRLLAAEPPSAEPPEPKPTGAESPVEAPPARVCPQCQTPRVYHSELARPGWNRVLNGPDRPVWYDPFHHALTWGRMDGYRTPPDG
jgi:hypothetical protein